MKFALIPILLALTGGISPLCAQMAQKSDADSTAASDAAALPQQTYGRVEHGDYVSPTGLYRLKVPVLAGLGGTISDTPNVVTFDDDYTVHISIAAFPLARELKSDLETRGVQDFLLHFFDSIVMPDFISNFPGSTREPKVVFLPHVADGAVLLFSLHPGGSNFEARSTIFPKSPKEKVVAKRGNLCFIKYDHIFVISTELAERALERSTYSKTPEEEDAILHDRLINLVGKIEFSPQKPASPN
jgi:hypothetical protein